MSVPRATVRLQFNAGFTLDDAVAVVPYYAALGISHVYASPLLQSRHGSNHGYDGVRTDRIDDELGGEPALRRLVASLRAHAMGLVLDIVPNHMSASLENPWWTDLLEHGRRSAFAATFDVDWEAGGGRLLLPWLEDPLHQRLAAGDAALRHDAASRRIHVQVGSARVPLGAATYAQVLDGSVAGSSGNDALAPFAARFAAAASALEFDSARDELDAAIASTPPLLSALEAALEAYLPTDDDRRARLQALLARQPWQLADWHAAPRRINWRRFFDIGALVALRIEDPQVFDAVHAYPLALFAAGLVDGLRIDHVDGLRDPAGYCQRLRAELQQRAPQRPEGLPRRAWLVVEKILAADEPLRGDWAIDGSTGYDFMEQVGALLHDASGEPVLDRAWGELAPGVPGDFASAALGARREILAAAFAADLQRALRALSALLDVPADDPALAAATRELVIAFPVYRTYIRAGGCGPEDRRVLERAAALARQALHDDVAALAMLPRLLEALCTPAADAAQRRDDALAALQQLTPPVAAKAIEDTAFYRYGRLLSRNEVGADPGQLASTVERFHGQCRARARDWPRALLATATHDHKRGEDARARLAVLSTGAAWWTQCVSGWRQRNAALRPGSGPDAADEAMLYQSLLGAWPPSLSPHDRGGLHALHERVAGWQQKALREAKRHSSWHAPDAAYESACSTFLQRLFDARAFVADLHAAVERVAAAGALRALTQTLLRLTAPGVPDLYQGTEFWDHSLVDPDNRRAVDHDARAQALHADAPLAALLAQWRDGRIKQRLLARALDLRRALPGLFSEGEYLPLAVAGPAATQVIAFLRRSRDATLLVLAPLHLGADKTAGAPLGLREDALAGTGLRGSALRGDWSRVLDGAPFSLHDDAVPLARILHDCPLGLLLRR